MKILLTADPEIPVPPVGYGGIERVVDALVRHYRDQGHTVGLVSHGESASPAHRKFAWPGASSSSRGDTWRNALALRRAARDFAPDVLHSFSRLVYLLPLLPKSLPKIMSYQRHTGGRQIAWAARFGGRSLRFTGCSEYICSMGRPEGGEWRAIPNFVELDKLTFVPRVPADAPLVFLSRIEAIKGPELAIAVARASGRRLLLAGNCSSEPVHREFWAKEIAPHLGRDGIEWIGEVNDAQKNELLGRAAAMIVPIQWDEPFGIVFPEALACGTPVITCARGALPEIVTEGRNGFFMRTVADGVAAVRRLDTLDRAACRRTAEEHFSLAVCGGRYLELYRALTAA
ncbi:MAG: glycosyltransferase [Opitutae bacterium]|nr:glycosyltransferase [Opitutae bacterium]